MSIVAERIAEQDESAFRPLQEGERMGQPEFHRRYEAMPPGVRAELIGGIVYMPSPMKRPHSKQQSRLSYWLELFEEAAPGTEALSAPSVILSDNSEPEPDGVLRILPLRGGLTHDKDDYVTGTPELVIEVAASTVVFDLGKKKAAYEKAGVPEYLVLLEGTRQARWFVLEEGKYVELQPDDNGVFHSRIFPGLRLPAAALFSGDKRRLRRALQEGTSTPEHKEWVRRLANTSTKE